jgi:hypothetical protein
MHPSGRPPILFLVFILIFCCGSFLLPYSWCDPPTIVF